jgi:hypothetical protein
MVPKRRERVGSEQKHVRLGTTIRAIITLKANTLDIMVTSDLFSARSVASIGLTCVSKTNRTEFVSLTFFYNFYFLFSVGRINDGKPYWKKKSKFTQSPMLEALTAR